MTRFVLMLVGLVILLAPPERAMLGIQLMAAATLILLPILSIIADRRKV